MEKCGGQYYNIFEFGTIFIGYILKFFGRKWSNTLQIISLFRMKFIQTIQLPAIVVTMNRNTSQFKTDLISLSQK